MLNPQKSASPLIAKSFLTVVGLNSQQAKALRSTFNQQCIRNSTYQPFNHTLCSPTKSKVIDTISLQLLLSFCLHFLHDFQQISPIRNHIFWHLPHCPKEHCLASNLYGSALLSAYSAILSIDCKKCAESSVKLASPNRLCCGGRKACIQTKGRYPLKMKMAELRRV